MRRLFLTLMLLGGGCATASPEALCGGTRQAAADHAAALAASPDGRAVLTGQALIARLDAGCGR